jgi:hypothetical protein
MPREDFSKQTSDLLAKRVGVRCDSVRGPVVSFRQEGFEHHVVNIGVAAHITAASAGGLRYDPSLTSQQRQSPDNGIWMCQNHAKLVDNDPIRYPAELLRRWKSLAEASALAELEGRAEPQPIDLSAELEVSYVKEQLSSKHHDYRLRITLTNRGSEPLGEYHVDLEMPAAVVRDPQQHPLYVRGRSTPHIAFFRVAAGRNDSEIYPGDSKIVMSVPYFMDNEIFWNHEYVLEQPVKVTLYRRGVRPVALEPCFGDFQIF